MIVKFILVQNTFREILMFPWGKYWMLKRFEHFWLTDVSAISEATIITIII